MIDPKKKKLLEEVDVLDTLGGESETQSAKFVIEKGKEEQKIAQEKSARQKEKLEKDRKTLARPNKMDDYKRNLLILVKTAMIDNRDELPKGYSWDARISPKGILLGIKTPAGKVYARGMKISGFSQFDHQGVSRLVFSALDQIAQWESQPDRPFNRTVGGIYLPN